MLLCYVLLRTKRIKASIFIEDGINHHLKHFKVILNGISVHFFILPFGFDL